MQTVLQADDLDQSVTNICHQIASVWALGNHRRWFSVTLQGGAEIDGIEAATRQLPLFVLGPPAEAERLARSLLDRRVSPQIGSAVGVRDVQQSDPLKRWTVGQIQ